MRVRAGAAFVVFASPLAVACGGRAESNASRTEPNFDVPSTFFHSGTRLKARVLRADAAPPVMLGIVDTAEERECAFHLAADGEVRCLPSPHVGVVAYADASCEDPLFGAWEVSDLDACPGAPLLASVTHMRQRSCEAESISVYELEHAHDLKTVHLMVQGSCEEAASWEFEELPQLHRLGEEVAPARFVRATSVDGSLSGRLVRRELKAEDGSSWPSSLYDVGMETSCAPRAELASDFDSSEEAPVLCLPGSAWDWVSVKPDCSDGVVVDVLEQACYDFGQTPAPYSRATGSWTRVSSEPMTEPLFGYGSNGCGPLAGSVFFEPGEAVAATAWHPLERVELGTRRIRVRGYADRGHFAAMENASLGAFFDSKKEAVCLPYSTPEGIVCIADAYGVDVAGSISSLLVGSARRYYADSARKERIFSTRFTVPAFVLEGDKGASTCDVSGPAPIEAAYPVGAKHTGPVFDEAGQLIPESERTTTTYYRLGSAVPWSKFPELRESIE